MNDTFDQTRLCDRGFEGFGVDWLCYVKRTVRHGRSEYSVHSADGTYLWRYADRATAEAALRQHEMEALSVH